MSVNERSLSHRVCSFSGLLFCCDCAVLQWSHVFVSVFQRWNVGAARITSRSVPTQKTKAKNGVFFRLFRLLIPLAVNTKQHCPYWLLDTVISTADTTLSFSLTCCCCFSQHEVIQVSIYSTDNSEWNRTPHRKRSNYCVDALSMRGAHLKTRCPFILVSAHTVQHICSTDIYNTDNTSISIHEIHS